MSVKTFLSVAASDCTAGAGIQADLRTSQAFGIYGMCALTGATAQNSRGLSSNVDMPPEFVIQQLKNIFEEITPDVVKLGLFTASGQLGDVCEWLSFNKKFPIVCDPVLGFTAGGSPSDVQDMAKAYFSHALKCIDILTPNRRELRLIAGASGLIIGDDKEAADILLDNGCGMVLVTGSESGIDVLYQKNMKPEVFESPFVDTPNLHGTGCVFSSAIACELASQRDEASSDIKDYKVSDAIVVAKRFLNNSLKQCKDEKFGLGYGPALFFGERIDKSIYRKDWKQA